MQTQLKAGLVAVAMLFTIPLTAGAAQQTGRYVLEQTGDGFVRLDTQTGSVAHCQKSDDKWQCENLDTAKDVDRTEIARLKKQNKELTARITRLEIKLRDLARSRHKSKNKLSLPSDQELDEMMGFFEKLVMRFMQFARTLQDPPGKDI